MDNIISHRPLPVHPPQVHTYQRIKGNKRLSTFFRLYKKYLQIRPRRLNAPRLARQTRDPLAVLARLPPAHGARLRRLARIRGGGPQRIEKRLGRLGSQVFVVVVVDLDHGGVDAGTQALDLDECEEAVGGGLSLLDPQVFFNGLDDGVAAAAAELAWCL